MRKALKTSRLIGLFALLAGFMAFGASAAQAEGTWLKNGTAITGNTPVQAKKDFTGGVPIEFVLLTKVGLSKVEILCTEIKLVGANLQVGGLGSGKAHFEGCVTRLNNSPAANCVPHSPGAPHGLIETNALHGSLRLHTAGIELYEVLATGAGVPIVVIHLGLGLCAIGLTIEVTGTLFLKDCKGEGLVDKVEHLFSEGPLSTLLFGANPMTIDGSAMGFLDNPNLGSTWAGHV